jgi:hypothetical protein
MRHLIVCCDGTWQNVAQQSNVSRFHSAVVTPPGSPEPHYIRGVGISRNPVAVLRGGITGADLSAGIINGYRWLVETYRTGDRIAVFGFSRGAYTARSLAGMIGRVGLVDGSDLDDEAVGDAVDRAYRRYRAIRDDPHDITWSAGLDFAYRAGEPDIPVDLVGVWDTVGSLGIPAYIGVPDVLGSRKRYEFLDVTLNPRIPHARHAISLDEMRGPYRPTLWRDVDPGQDVKQMWFPGNHMDVGGGNRDKRLADCALDWMMAETTAAIGTAFDRARIPGFDPDPTGFLHGPRGGPLGAAHEVAFQPRPRGGRRARRPELDRHRPVPRTRRLPLRRLRRLEQRGLPLRPRRRHVQVALLRRPLQPDHRRRREGPARRGQQPRSRAAGHAPGTGAPVYVAGRQRRQRASRPRGQRPTGREDRHRDGHHGHRPTSRLSVRVSPTTRWASTATTTARYDSP